MSSKPERSYYIVEHLMTLEDVAKAVIECLEANCGRWNIGFTQDEIHYFCEQSNIVLSYYDLKSALRKLTSEGVVLVNGEGDYYMEQK
jgi:hypothetical protein